MKKIDGASTSKELFKNTGIIAIGQMSTKIVTFLLLPLYTALLTAEEYGLVDLLATYSTVLSIIIGLQMHLAVFRFLVTNRSDEDKIKSVCSSVVFLTAIAFAIYILAFIVVNPFLTIKYSWYLLFHVGATIYLQIIGGIARGLGKNIYYALGNFFSSSITIILNVLFIAIIRLDVMYMLLAYIIGPLVGGTIVFVKVRMWQYFSFSKINKMELKSVMNYALPLVPNELSWSVIHASDRVVVSTFLGVAINGLIAVAAKLSSIYTTVFYIFNASWTEQVVLHYKDEGGKEYICSMFDKMVSLFACFAIGIIACMPLVFPWFVGSEFSNSYNLIPFYMLAVFFNVVIGLISPIYLVENETKKVASSTIIAAIINILVDVLLIKIIGMYAAPISSICGYMTISFWRLWDVNKRHCKISISIKKVLILVSLFILVSAAFFIKNIFFVLIAIVITAVFAIIMNIEIIKMLGGAVFSKYL